MGWGEINSLGGDEVMMTVTLAPEVTDHLGLRELESGEGCGASLRVI